MLRALTLFLVVMGLLAPSAAAQGNQARATLYTRVAGDQVQAAVVIRIQPDWYLYHTDLGHPDAIGTPLALTFGEASAGWSAPTLPEPHVGKVETDYDNYTYNYHSGKIVLYAAGDVSAGADSGDSLSLTGLTCSNVSGTCIPYSETVSSKGEGSDKYWTDWPETLVASAAEAQGDVEMPGGPASAPESAAAAISEPVTVDGPSGFSNPFGGSSVQSGSAAKVGTTLYVRIDEDANVAKAVVVLDVAPGWHIYHGPDAEDMGHPEAAGITTKVALEGGGVEWGAASYPEPHRAEAGYEHLGDPVWYYEHSGRVRLVFEGEIFEEPDPDDVIASVEIQACDATGCLPPSNVEVENSGTGEDADFAAHVLSSEEGNAQEGEPELIIAGGAPSQDSSLVKYLLLAVMWGLVTLLMPCTYPMIPITISFFTKQATTREGSVLPLSLAYGGGIVLMFIIMGAVLGAPIQLFANHPITQLVIGGLFIFFAMVLFGVINLQPPAMLMTMAGKAQQKGGVAGVFLMGTTLVITSFSCTAPFVGDIIARSGTGGLLRPILGMGVFGLTMAVPFVLLSLFPARLQKMPSAGEWMHVLKVFLGFVELAAAFKFISGADLTWNLGLLPDELFLIIWMGIFLAAAMFLFGWIHLEGETKRDIGPRRMVTATMTLLLSFYCGYGILGFKMDPVMLSILPGYKADRVGALIGSPGGGGEESRQHQIIKDDYEHALEVAIAEDKLLLINFTGFN